MHNQTDADKFDQLVTAAVGIFLDGATQGHRTTAAATSFSPNHRRGAAKSLSTTARPHNTSPEKIANSAYHDIANIAVKDQNSATELSVCYIINRTSW